MAENILVIGANGQLGYDIVKALERDMPDANVFTPSHKDLDIESCFNIDTFIIGNKITTIINTSAEHNVPEIQKIPNKAYAINTKAMRDLANMCNYYNVKLVHISTDYVYGGFPATKEEGYNSMIDEPCPVNIYGMTKALGEKAIQEEMSVTGKYFIVRVAGLFGVKGPASKPYNFIDLMIHLAEEGKEISVVNDQFMCVTSCKEVATQIVSGIKRNFCGVANITNTGKTTWREVAYYAINKHRELKGEFEFYSVLPTKTKEEEYWRPKDSYMQLTPIFEMSPWKDAVDVYIKDKYFKNQEVSEND